MNWEYYFEYMYSVFISIAYSQIHHTQHNIILYPFAWISLSVCVYIGRMFEWQTHTQPELFTVRQPYMYFYGTSEIVCRWFPRRSCVHGCFFFFCFWDWAINVLVPECVYYFVWLFMFYIRGIWLCCMWSSEYLCV